MSAVQWLTKYSVNPCSTTCEQVPERIIIVQWTNRSLHASLHYHGRKSSWANRTSRQLSTKFKLIVRRTTSRQSQSESSGNPVPQCIQTCVALLQPYCNTNEQNEMIPELTTWLAKVQPERNWNTRERTKWLVKNLELQKCNRPTIVLMVSRTVSLDWTETNFPSALESKDRPTKFKWEGKSFNLRNPNRSWHQSINRIRQKVLNASKLELLSCNRTAHEYLRQEQETKCEETRVHKLELPMGNRLANAVQMN